MAQEALLVFAELPGAVGVAGGIVLLAVGMIAGLFAARSGRGRELDNHLGEERRQARTDDLTDLPNRRAFTEEAERRIGAAMAAEESIAMLLLDLDRFKDINDTLGHRAGDHLLQEVARRLPDSVEEAAHIARLGGDEFVVLLRPGLSSAAVEEIAHATVAALDAPIELEGLTTNAQASLGIATAPAHGTTREELLRAADIAMYRAKRTGTRISAYAPEDNHVTLERLKLASDLRVALERKGQLILHFQPQADIGDGGIVGVEALARWEHPERGLLFPDEFIPLAEQHGLMFEFTLAVLEQALETQSGWHAEGIPVSVAVNVSPANLLDTRFAPQVAGLIAKHNTPEDSLVLEITEETALIDPARALEVLSELRRFGVRLSLDDFGTGHSSLTYLKRLPIQELKIDKSFVLGAPGDHGDATIVRSTVDLARNLGLHVVAEGVETAEHWEQLARFGCHTAQGYHLSRPMPAAALPEWMDEYEERQREQVTPVPARRPDAAPRSRDHLTSLLEAAEKALEADTLHNALAGVIRQLRVHIPYDDLGIYELDEESNELFGLYAEGGWADEVMSERFPADEGITGAAVADGETRMIARADEAPDSVTVSGTDDGEAESLVCVPLISGGRRLGALNVYRVGEGMAFSPLEAELVERFAAVAALAVAAARRQEEAQTTIKAPLPQTTLPQSVGVDSDPSDLDVSLPAPPAAL